jgi:predicted DNA-binding protein
VYYNQRMAIKSFRISEELQLRVRQAAERRGMRESEFVREALERAVEADAEERHHLVETIREVAIEGQGPPVAHRTHEAFAELVAERHARSRAR